ncbi:MAG TPA: hypothetical protein VD835_16735, partial [Pyrinomonadaceae bacterium]|nr:hypothetical protein [Pyrinomonadaceae bacterium]
MKNTTHTGKTILLTCILLAASAAASSAQPQRSGMPPPPPSPRPTPVSAIADAVPPASNAPQKIMREGINVEFKVEPIAKTEGLMEGKEAFVTFSVKDAATGQPLTNLRPA